MFILQILLLGWLLFVYIIVWQTIENPRTSYVHGLLAQATIESIETWPFRNLWIGVIFLLGPLFALLTYLGIILIIILIALTCIYGWFAEKTSKAKQA